jgi:transcriptional regulator with XRE-family HTH domain
MSDRHTLPPFSLRMPNPLRDKLEDIATGNGQSLNAWLQCTLADPFVLSNVGNINFSSRALSERNRVLALALPEDISAYPLRMPTDLGIKLKETARANNRSLNKEILNRLLCELPEDDFQEVAGVIMKRAAHVDGPEVSVSQQIGLEDPAPIEKNGICKRLKSERKRLNQTQAEAAMACGISREVWCRYERGMTQPGAEVLQAFAKVGANPEFLLTGEITQTFLTAQEELLLERFRRSPEPIKAASLRMLDNDQ